MAAPVFLCDSSPGAKPGDVIVVSGSEGHHAAQVARLRTGEDVELVDGAGRRLIGQVVAVARDRIDVQIGAVTHESYPDPRIIVIQALPKGDRAERAVESMTEVGVDIIVPWSAANCVVRWTHERALKALAKWRLVALAASKQSRRAWVPEVCSLHSTSELVSWMTPTTTTLLLDETSDIPLASIPLPAAGDIVLIVGPEGGVSPQERVFLGDMGARAVRLGPTVLRTSTAGAVGAAVVASRTPRWGPTSSSGSCVPG